MATFDDFMKLDIRVGTIVEAKVFEKAKRPAYQLLVDFGSEIVLYPLDDAKIVVDKLNWYELFVKMLKENLEYEGWTEDDFKGLIEDVEVNLE